MFVYRLASRLYAPNDSEGARLYGGRWNQPGTPVIYTSATRALAALEVIVHYGAIPEDYRIVVIELPDGLAIENISLDDLPEEWPGESSAKETANRGSGWASSLRTAVLRAPSAAIRSEHNYVLNPLHPISPRSGSRFQTPNISTSGSAPSVEFPGSAAGSTGIRATWRPTISREIGRRQSWRAAHRR